MFGSTLRIQADSPDARTRHEEKGISYYYGKRLETSFDEAIENVTGALKAERFGILTETDVDFHRYRILGACNPTLAHTALGIERRIGAMLPCNVIVQENADGSAIEVAAVDPVASMQAVENPDLGKVASEVRGKLHKVIDSLRG